MTRRGYLITLFPLLHISCIAGAFLIVCHHFSLATVCLLIFSIYLLPILCMRIHNGFAPMKEGATNLTESTYSPWWGTHQFQAIFNAIPAFEAILRLIPGAYSSWMRLWGSKIGKNIHWTPLVEITDRSLMDIGDHVIFGHKVACVSHVILHKPDQLLLYVKRVTIGNNVFVGAGSRLAPGARVDDHMVLDYLTVVKINQHLKKDSMCLAGE